MTHPETHPDIRRVKSPVRSHLMSPSTLSPVAKPGMALAVALACALTGGLSLTLPSHADALRDPTIAPSAVRAAEAASAAGCGTTPCPAGAAASDAGAPALHLMILNGKPYVIERGWPRGVGDRLGSARIERIDAQALWLREDGTLRRVPLYEGVKLSRTASDDTEHPTARARKSAAAPQRARRPAPASPQPEVEATEPTPFAQEARP